MCEALYIIALIEMEKEKLFFLVSFFLSPLVKVVKNFGRYNSSLESITV